MAKKYFFVLFLCSVVFASCNDSEEEYVPVPVEPVSPINVDLTRVPYANLSEYHFFSGEMKNLIPEVGVLPFKPSSSLFTDYALKKRFVWMPKGYKATYNSDGTILNFPVGAVLIKNFYYETIQPGNLKKNIETRVMIKKESGWIFAEYVWNDAQTEAVLESAGSYKTIHFIDPSGENITTNYRIPSNTECLICHKTNEVPFPVGVKPQNLNFNYPYQSGEKNQLQKWIEQGYLENNLPNNITSTVNYEDVSKPLEERMRSYVDANCAHCHKTNSHCDYRPIRLAFNETSIRSNLGVCVPPDEVINTALTNIISPGNKNRSVMYYRLNTTEESARMPLLGRSVIHKEGILLLEQYINSLSPCN